MIKFADNSELRNSDGWWGWGSPIGQPLGQHCPFQQNAAASNQMPRTKSMGHAYRIECDFGLQTEFEELNSIQPWRPNTMMW